MLHEEGQAAQSVDWRRGWDKQGEVRNLVLPRQVSGSPKRADADQRLAGDATPDELVGEVHHSAMKPSKGMVDYLTRAENVTKELELAVRKLA